MNKFEICDTVYCVSFFTKDLELSKDPIIQSLKIISKNEFVYTCEDEENNIGLFKPNEIASPPEEVLNKMIDLQNRIIETSTDIIARCEAVKKIANKKARPQN